MRRSIRVLALLALLAAGSRPVASQVTPIDVAAARSNRVPVVLVPGWSEEADQLDELEARFVEAGWPEAFVVTVDFEDPEGSNVVHARAIADSASALRARAGVPAVDVVAHSMGGLATRYWLATTPNAPVRRVVFLATPHRGTLMSLAAWGEGGREMRPGSAFLLELGSLRGVPERVEALTIRSKTDMHVIPNSSATLPGVPDVELCCPTHAGLLQDPDVFDALSSFLLRTP